MRALLVILAVTCIAIGRDIVVCTDDQGHQVTCQRVGDMVVCS